MRSTLFALCLAVGLPIAAQTNISCKLVPGSVKALDARCCTMLVQVKLQCGPGTATAPGAPVPMVNIQVTANVPLAPPAFFDGSLNYDGAGFTNLYIDTPATHDAEVAAGNGQTSGGMPTGVGGNGLDYSNPFVPNGYFGDFSGAYSARFVNVALDPSPNGRTLTIDLWVKTCQENSSSSVSFDIKVAGIIVGSVTYKLGSGSTPQDARTTPADSSSGAGPTYSVTPSSLDLGSAVNCWEYLRSTGSAPANTALNTGLLGSSPTVPSTPSATLSFAELFPACLQVPSSGYQDDLNQFYDNYFGFTNLSHPLPFANVGTQLQAAFNNIPAGVSVFVQTSATSAAGIVKLTSNGTALGSTGLTQIPVSNGSATAIWAAQTADATATGEFTIPVYFAYQSGVASPSHITVVQSLASAPSGIQYLPPPANLIRPVLFSVYTGASTTPKMTATVDSRPCILGVTFWTNNACTPSNGLFVSIVSDSASVAAQSPALSSTGGITGFVLGGASTPMLAEIYPNVSNAVPGVYQETMTVTGVGASTGASLSVPFTVTVLPPNNPVFELNAVYDAFSYQSATIAPGQIYTIFGSNLGPSALASGTVDASGKLSTEVANTQVLFDGVVSPLLYVVNGQLSGVAPFELAGKTSTNVQIVTGTMKSPVVAVPVVPSSISIAGADGSGGNGAVVLNKDGSLNTVSNPASAGDTVVIYAAYAGPFANGVKGTDGRTTIAAPYPAPSGTPTVTIGGVQATSVLYFGNAPGLLESVMQINVVIPAGVPSSPYNSLVISAGGVNSTGWTTIAVQ
jgi:uncharacterized protein (TIGR03437 family)